jgi:ADP-ribosyl-[dinitrogen reductase] hydrolase
LSHIHRHSLPARVAHLCSPRLERSLACMIGLAAAEAMAVDVILERNDWQETMPGRGHARAGEWSDATATALCLAESLFEAGRFDLADQMERFLRWLRDGYPAKVRRSLRIDRQMAEALRFYEKNGNPYGGDCGHRDAGDGALVRLAPIAIVWQTNPALAIQRAGQQALTTNPGTISVDACRLLCALLLAALDGCPQEQILDWDRHPYRHLFRGEHALCAEIDAIAHGDYLDRSFDDLGHAGSAAGTLRRALLAFSKANFFRLGAKISAHNGSGLTGSAAVYGMLAGIVFGLDSDDTRRPQGIPEEMSGSLCEADLLLSHALRAYSVGSLPQLTELAPAKPIAVAIEDPIVSMLPVEGRLTPLGQGHRREYELRLFGRIPRINKFTLTDADSLGLVGRRRKPLHRRTGRSLRAASRVRFCCRATGVHRYRCVPRRGSPARPGCARAIQVPVFAEVSAATHDELLWLLQADDGRSRKRSDAAALHDCRI